MLLSLVRITLSGERAGGGGNGKEWLLGQDITLLGSGSLSGQNLNVVGKHKHQFLMIIKRKTVPARMNTTVEI